MKLLALTAWAMGLGMVAAGGDMKIEFPGNMLIKRAELLKSNLMTFAPAIGGFSAPPITSSGNDEREYLVDGNTLVNFHEAWKRSCNIQQNLCSDFANTDPGRSQGVEVSDCESQLDDCESAEASQTVTAFASLKTSDSEYDYYCES